KNIIVDHCSASWSTDETLTAYGVENFTLQWCMITESLYNSAHRKGTHGYGGIWGGKNASFHHNLLAHHDSRNPRFDHPGVSKLAGVVDFRNNVIYNWGKNLSYGGETRTINLIGNYYKPGPAMAKNKDTYFFNPMNQTKKDEAPQGYGKFFIQGNILEGNKAINQDNKKGIKPQNPVEIEELLTATPFPDGGVQTQPATAAYALVLKDAGASYRRDAVDTRIVEEVETGTATFGGTYGAKKGIIDSQTQAGGWPVLKSLPAPADTDGDGMPDEWEKKQGLDPNNKKDGNQTTLYAPYTNLEVYLNSIVEK
ncbi:MAG: thrombospondin type 3 repeat-containing protein, partial [Bacteroidales bacterium]